MPKVGSKHFPYNASGLKKAKAYARKTGKKLKKTKKTFKSFVGY